MENRTGRGRTKKKYSRKKNPYVQVVTKRYNGKKNKKERKKKEKRKCRGDEEERKEKM